MKFTREERLKSSKIINALFKGANSFSCYPLRLVWQEVNRAELPLVIQSPSPILFSLSVPKKTFKRAVDRNVLRRHVRESYRLNKEKLYNLLKNNELYTEKQFAFMVLYTGKEAFSYEEIDKGIKKMIYKFEKELQTTYAEPRI
jgi:ribonuclease P protein component